MEALTKLLGPIIGSTAVGSFHMNSNSHRSGDCPCKLMTSSSSIWTAAETNDYNTVFSRVTSNSTLISKFDVYGYTALHYAAQHNHIRIVEFLLGKGCPPDANSCGATPLHRAAYSGSIESCELLLKAGADVNAIDSSYRDMSSPLHKAYSVANAPAVVLLLSHGANPLQINASGKTPVQLLKTKHHEEFHLLAKKIEANANTLGTEFCNDSKMIETAALSRQDTSDVVHTMQRISVEIVPDFEIASLIVPTSSLQLSSKPFVASSFEDTRSTSAKSGEISKWTTVGLQCSRCGINCISFTRLLDGSLICTECKYRSPTANSLSL